MDFRRRGPETSAGLVALYFGFGFRLRPIALQSQRTDSGFKRGVR